MIETPIFLVGAERSGTTLLRLMLGHHPKIAFHQEFEFSVNQIDEDGNFPNLEDYYEFLSSSRIFLRTGFTIDKNLSYPELINDFLLQRQKRDSKPLIGATVHRKFDRLLLFWPKAKFIHIVRDGRDVARSNITMGWAGNLFTGVDLWITAEQLWRQLAQKLNPEQKLTVYYEILSKEPEQVLREICQFIGVPFDQKMFDYAKQTNYDSPNADAVERWRKLPAHDLQLAECKIADLLTEHGYPLSGLPIIPVTSWLHWQMLVHSRMKRILFRLRRYPFNLYVADVISRRLPLKNWRKQVRLRLNEHDKKYLK